MADSYCFPWCSWHPRFHVSPLAVPSNLAVAHVRSPHGKHDHAIHRLISVNAAHARSPMANGDYATHRLIPIRAQHNPTLQLTNGKQRPLPTRRLDYLALLHLGYTEHRSAAAQPQGGHSKAYCADGQSCQFVSVSSSSDSGMRRAKAMPGEVATKCA